MQRLRVFASSHWRLSRANMAYQLCPSYPTEWVVPSTISDADLCEIAKFRSHGRVPILTYMHDGTHKVTFLLFMLCSALTLIFVRCCVAAHKPTSCWSLPIEMRRRCQICQCCHRNQHPKP